MSEIDADFQQNRRQYPALFIVTPFDDGSSPFTRRGCAEQTLRRLGVLARAALAFVEKVDVEEKLKAGKVTSGRTRRYNDGLLQQVFVPSLSGYNAVIYVKHLMNARRHEKLDFEKKGDYKLVLEPYVEDEGNKIPVVDFNPIDCYLTELRVSGAREFFSCSGQ